MLTASRLALAGLMVAATSFAASHADAQVGVRYGWGGVRVSTPGVGVRVGRFGGVRVSTPGGYYSRTPGRVYYGPRPVVPGGFYYRGPGVTVRSGVTTSGAIATGSSVVAGGAIATGTPTPANPEVSAAIVTSAKPTLAASAGLATEAELAAMGGVELLAATSEASAALQSRLASFQNGAGWQTYLAFDAATAGNLDAAESLLRRFDSVARDAKFGMIAQLDEFSALRTALRVLVDRGGVAIDASSPGSTAVRVEVQGESLPAPGADVPGANVDVDVSAGGVGVKVERSVLKSAQ